MSIAQVGGAGSPTVIYAKNDSGTTLSVGSVVMEKVVDGAGDGYKWVLPDIDTTKPESLYARRGVVYAADSAATFADGADIALVVEGYVSEVLVDATSPISVGDLLISQDASARLIVAAAGSIDLVVDALTAANMGEISATASAEAGNTSTSQVFHDVTVTINANELAVGDVIEYFGQGYIADSNSTDTAIISVQAGGTDIGLSAAIDVADDDVWSYSCKGYVTAIGASGSVTWAGTGAGPDALGVATAWPINAVTSSLDTTAAITLRTGVQFSGSHADNGSIQRLIGYQVLRKSAIVADLTALRDNVVTLVDKTKVVAVAHEASSSATGSIAATIIKR